VLDRGAVDLDAVRAHQVDDRPAVRFLPERGVAPGDGEIGEHDLVLVAAPDAHLLLLEVAKLLSTLM